MENEPLVIRHVYHAPVDVVWRAITNIEEMRQWYMHELTRAGFHHNFYGIQFW